LEFVMANVSVIQRNAHLAGVVKLEFVNGREGKVAKAVLTAISNTRRGADEAREEEATAIEWTLWGKQAENAAEYLGKGSHVNIAGRLRNNNYEKDGEAVYGVALTAHQPQTTAMSPHQRPPRSTMQRAPAGASQRPNPQRVSAC
jgi:single-strand DNA-binding protein